MLGKNFPNIRFRFSMLLKVLSREHSVTMIQYTDCRKNSQEKYKRNVFFRMVCCASFVVTRNGALNMHCTKSAFFSEMKWDLVKPYKQSPRWYL